MSTDLYDIVKNIYVDENYDLYNNGNYPLYKWLRIKEKVNFKINDKLYVEQNRAIKFNNVMYKYMRFWKDKPIY